MLRTKELLNAAVAKNAAMVIADAAQACLVRSKHMLSGDDTNLKNTWEEICVQVQGEKSYFWEAYEDAMRGAVLGVMQFLDRGLLQTLWLHTDEGWDLRCDLGADEAEGLTAQADYEPPDIPVDDEAIARHIIAKYLLLFADDYTNSRIEEFLYPGDDDIYDDAAAQRDEGLAPPKSQT